MGKYSIWFTIGIIVIATMLRFYKLDFGEGLYTHPDEYHIAGSVAQLVFPSQMHPHFFSYGTATIYPIYFIRAALAFFLSIFHSSVSIPDAFLIGRFLSAFFSTLTVILIGLIGRFFLKEQYVQLAMLLVALSPGAIQQAHFATPESELTFFIFAALFFLLKFLKKRKMGFLLAASMMVGIGMGVKIVASLFLPVLYVAILWNYKKSLLTYIQGQILSTGITVLTFFSVAPFVFLDFKNFQSNTEYEGSLATGKLLVFYTRQFIDTIPILFQAKKILPYAVGPFLEIFGFLGVFVALAFIFYQLYKNKKGILYVLRENGAVSFGRTGVLFFISLTFLILFIANALLFTKWTRFIAPTFPFFGLYAAFFLQEIHFRVKNISYIVVGILVVATMFWANAFFSIYTHHDVRVAAAKKLSTSLFSGVTYVVEGGNMIDLPLEGNFQKISLDFYSLEDDFVTRQKIVDALSVSQYFIVES